MLPSVMVERGRQPSPVSLSGALSPIDEGGPDAIRSVDLSRNGCRIENAVQVVPGMNIALFSITSWRGPSHRHS